MGVGKYFLYGLGGFMLVGAAAMPFMPEMTPEQDLASGQRYFANQCEDVTRNRMINGNFGRGHVYCGCVSERLAAVLSTGDEYRYAEALHEASGRERIVLEKTRMAQGIKRARERFSPVIGLDRIHAINQDFYDITVSCARSM